MFSINLFNKLEPLSVYVVKPTGDIIGCLDDEINESTGSLTVGLNQQYELTFEIHKADNSIWFDYLQEGMYLLVDKIGLFKMKQPEMALNGFDDTKTISAFSCDVELEDKNCEISINMGTKVSQEYLVSDSSCDKEGYLSYIDSNNITQYELIKDPYTNLPYDWIYLHNVIPAQINIFKTKYFKGNSANGGYGTLSNNKRTISNADEIAEFQKYVNIIPRLKHKFYVRTVDSNEEYSLYSPISSPSGNPSTSGYYELVSGNYVSSTDTSVVSGKTYYYSTEYITYTYTSDEITTITINNEIAFKQRISDLKCFYEKYCKQLSLLDIVLEEMGGDWTVGDIYGEGTVQDSADKYVLSNKKFQFEISENIYSFLTQTLASTIECVVNFDIINRRVNVVPVAQIGKDTGIVMSYDNLINSMNVTCEEENLSTRLFPKGANDLTIGRANYGQEYVVDLSYKMNAKDKDNNLLYVDSELAAKYETYINYLEAHRADYIQYSKDIDRLNKEINEIKYRVPADDLKTDWGTFKKEELEANLTAYKNLLATLITLYKEDYGTAGCNNDGSVNESYIKNTFYWYDYKAYKGIIDEIECAIATFPYYSDQDKWTESNTTEYKNKIKAWETEWSLFGTVELQNKIDTYKGNMDLLAEKSVIRLDATSEKTALDTAKSNYERDKDSMTDVQKQAALADIATKDRAFNVKYYNIKTWSNLTDDEKTAYGGTSANYYYDKYMEYYNFFIGNESNAYDYLITLKAQTDTLTTEMNTAIASRAGLNTQATLSGFTNGEANPYFTANEIKIITRLYRDADYSNENILTTNISTTDEVIDTCLELLEDAKDHISISSRPQLTFAVEADNILGLAEYQPMWSDFKSGNYMMVQYRDDTYVKLRIVAFTFNPFLPTSKNFKIEFSNFTRSRVLIADTSSILGLASATSSRSSSSGGSSGSGAFGESDDIDITISNTMLAKLLSSEGFGARITNIILDTLDVNALTAKSATFQGLANGSTTIDGGCVTTGSIQSHNYSYDSATGVETGSILILQDSTDSSKDGTFSFGSGKLKWDGSTLSVNGTITAGSGSVIGGWTIGANKIYNNDLTNGLKTAIMQKPTSTTTYVFAAGGNNNNDYSDCPFRVTKEGKLFATNAEITGIIKANGFASGLKTGYYDSHTGLYIDYEGNIAIGNQNEVVINKDGSFNFGNGGIRYDSTNGLAVNGAITATSLTLSNSGAFSVGNTPSINTTGFNLSSAGLLTASNAVIYGTIYASDGSFSGNISLGGNNNTNGSLKIYNASGAQIGSWDKNGINASTGNFAGTINASGGCIGHWDIDNNGIYLKGTSLDSEEIRYTCTLTKKKVAYGWAEYRDKYGFTVHNYSSKPYFQYYVRQVNIDGAVGYMLMEEAISQGISATSGAVDTIRVYRSEYDGAEILIGQVVSTNHSEGFPLEAYYAVETVGDLNTLKGQVRPLSTVVSGGIIATVMRNISMFDDDLGDNGNFYNPLYETAYSNDGFNVIIPNHGSNVLLSYEKESAISGYTYLTSQSSANSFVPIIAIDVNMNNNVPDFSTAKTVLYNDGTIKAVDIKCNSAVFDSIISDKMETLEMTSDKFVAGNNGEFTITDSNYSNITLRKYIENILRTHNLIA